ncbi:MAG: hypothetical protein HYZ15_11860 [Sphingobacteriales bacterium]|nr:hypothetical protein [Sphingobacteriales bacterium]
MKITLLILLTFIGLNAGAQSLKDLLYSGKMKTDSNTVVRKGDDLKDKVDTSAKKPAPAEKTVPAAVKDSVIKKTGIAPDTVTGISAETAPVAPVTPVEPLSITKDNNKRWKEFADTVIGSIKAEVLSSKKIKKGDYSILIDYTINTDGSVTIGNIFISPESSYLLEQLKERLGIDTPRLNPVLNPGGTARKVNKRYSVILSKQ